MRAILMVFLDFFMFLSEQSRLKNLMAIMIEKLDFFIAKIKKVCHEISLIDSSGSY